MQADRLHGYLLADLRLLPGRGVAAAAVAQPAAAVALAATALAAAAQPAAALAVAAAAAAAAAALAAPPRARPSPAVNPATRAMPAKASSLKLPNWLRHRLHSGRGHAAPPLPPAKLSQHSIPRGGERANLRSECARVA